jgi:hypothetical protein
MHPSRIEPMTSWKHVEVLTGKLIQHFINKDERIEVYDVWNEIV